MAGLGAPWTGDEHAAVREAGEAFAALLRVPAVVAARALGRAADAVDPQEAATRLFDALRLRRGIFDAMAWRHLGDSDEDRWHAGALVHAALAHTRWRAGGDPDAPPPWREDHDVRWLIGVNEHEGATWFGREAHARFTWWRALPALVVLASKPSTTLADLAVIEAWTGRELAKAKATGWSFDALLGGDATVASPSTAASPGGPAADSGGV